MSDVELQPIDWSGGSYPITDDVTLELSKHTGATRGDIIQSVIRSFEETTPFEYYVYSLKLDKDSDTSWYIGQTENLTQRIYSHINSKNVTNIERVEGVDSREDARERERELSYEIAIEKKTTKIYGGR